MIRKLLCISAIVFAAACLGLVSDGQEPKAKPAPQKFGVGNAPPIHSTKGVVCSPFDPEHKKFPRGLWKTSKNEKLGAKKFDPKGVKVPSQVLMVPSQLSMWGNDQYGDCVSASEAARIAAYSVFCGLPETFIPEATAISWASAGGYLNGANLTDVMTDRMTRGMADAGGKLYLAGPYTSVDYTVEATLQAALASGPVNFGIDANALPSAAGNANGWYAFGGSPGSFNNEDHCTPSFGFVTGPMAAQTAFQALGAAVPAGAPTTNVYLWFTWNTIGVVDFPWIMSTAGEAWLQNPTTVGQTPNPTPIPPVPPSPPTPGTVGITLTADQVASVLAQAGVSATSYNVTVGPDGTITLTPTIANKQKLQLPVPAPKKSTDTRYPLPPGQVWEKSGETWVIRRKDGEPAKANPFRPTEIAGR